MKEELRKKCELFVQNRNEMNHIFGMELSEMIFATALILTGEGKTANKEECKAVEKQLLDKTGVLSDYRGNVKLPLICRMLISEDSDAYFEKVKVVYEILSKKKWSGSDYKLMAAMTICNHTNEAEYQKNIDRTNEILDKMKENHKWLTGEEDIPFAAMLAVSDMDVDKLIDEAERCFALLRKKFGNNDVVQSLSHVLALGEQSAEDKCEKLFKVHSILHEKKHKYGKDGELTALGALVICEPSAEEIADMIIEVDEFIKEFKGFGNFSLGATQRRMYAAMLCLECLDDKTSAGNATILTNAIIDSVAAEVALMLCVSACVIIATSD